MTPTKKCIPALGQVDRKLSGVRLAVHFVMNVGTFRRLLEETFIQWTEDKPFQMGAALAYYTFFSIAPLLLIAIAVAGFVFGREVAQNRIVDTIAELVGVQTSRAIQALLNSAGRRPEQGFFATALGTVLLLVGAGGVVGQLQESLNTIWGVTPKIGRGMFGLLKDRFFSYAMVLGVGFLLLVSLVISAGLSALSQLVGGFLPGVETLAHGVDLSVSFAFITLLFALIYRYVPDIRIRWRDVWIGAAITSLLFSVGKVLIGIYLGHSSVTSAYGAAGSLVTLLLWVYYSSLIFFFGAEFTQVYASKFGLGVVPSEIAAELGSKTRQSPAPEARQAAQFSRRESQPGSPKSICGTGSRRRLKHEPE